MMALSARPGAVSLLWLSLIDDAAMFPPKQAELATALSDRLGRLRSADDDFVGSFLVPSARAANLLDALAAAPPPQPLAVGIVNSDDLAAAADAAARLVRSELIRLDRVELRLDPATDPVDAVTEAAAGLGAIGGADATTAPRVLCEVPHSWLEDGRLVAAVAAASAAGLGAKLRTGGATPQAIPTVAAVARFVAVCVQHGVAFKCTAGLHRAVRSQDRASGLIHHGFANVLLATHLALVGAPPDRIRSALNERRAATVAAQLAEVDDEQAAAVRGAFLSYGSCDTSTPVSDIAHMLVPVP